MSRKQLIKKYRNITFMTFALNGTVNTFIAVMVILITKPNSVTTTLTISIFILKFIYDCWTTNKQIQQYKLKELHDIRLSESKGGDRHPIERSSLSD